MPNALLVQRRSVSVDNPGLVAMPWDAIQPGYRIPELQNVHIGTAVPGGWMTGDFTIPAEYNRFQPPKNTQVHIYDGIDLMFMGFVRKTVENLDGGLDVTCCGTWDLLGMTLMRSVWADGDLAAWQPSPGNAEAGNITLNSGGRLIISVPKDHSLAAGQHVSIDYFLFGEAGAPRDNKQIDGYQITIGTPSTAIGATALDIQMYGLDNTGTSATLIHTFNATGTRTEYSLGGIPTSQYGGTRLGALPGQGDNVTPWSVNQGYGFRLLRFGIFANTQTNTYPEDKVVSINLLRVSTRANSFGFDPDPSTVDIMRDLWNQPWETGNIKDSGGFTTNFDTALNDIHQLASTENQSLGPATITKDITDTGTPISNYAAKDWSTPRSIAESLAAIDGYPVGMYGPQDNPLGSCGYTTTALKAANWKHRRPAKLVYKPWSDLTNPDYVARMAMGAIWEPDTSEEHLVSATYSTYQTSKGINRSVYTEDSTVENYLWEQGWHEAELQGIDQPVGDATAATLAAQYLQRNRQPGCSGTLTILGDRPGALELAGGARCGPLHTIRPGIIRIADAPGAQVGMITALDLSLVSRQEPVDKLVLTINAPAAQTHQRQTEHLASHWKRGIKIGGLKWKPL